MAETSRAFQDKTVTLPNGLKVHYYENPDGLAQALSSFAEQAVRS
jgi:hypothetical protein